MPKKVAVKRQLTISALSNAKTVSVENRILTRDIPSPTDAKQVVNVDSHVYHDKIVERPQFGILPPGTRWMSGDGHSLLIEEEPGYKQVLIKQRKANSPSAPHSYSLAIPRIIYGISPDASFNPYVSHLWTRPHESIRHDSDWLHWLPLPNIFRTGAICTHTLINEHMDAPYHTLINRAISDFWNSGFNYDVGDFGNSSGYHQVAADAARALIGDVWAYWSDAAPEYIRDLNYDKICRVSSAKETLIAQNHTYSIGVGEPERFITTLVALGLENSI